MAIFAIRKVAPPFAFLFPPSSPPTPPTTPSSPPAQPPAPPPRMQPRGADERPDRLSLIPVVRDLHKAVEGQPVAPPPPAPRSQMEWDEEEEVAPSRPQDKVRQRVREVTFMYRRLAAAATAIQVNNRDVKTPEHGSCIPVNESRKGSVRNARMGIEKRRKYEISSLRAYDELMSPVAVAHQRAFLPKKIKTKHQQQEISWPKKLREKASARSLKSATSFTGMRKFGGSSSSLPRTPSQSPAIGNLTPPVPRIPTRYVEGSQESLPRLSPFGSVNMPTIEISPFLAHENLAPARSSMSPPPLLTPTLRVPGSATTLNTLGMSPSREFPSGPEDPFWDEAVARVKATVRRDQEEERRERKATAKAERRVIRNITKDRDGHLKWAKLTIDMLAGKYDEHGWLPKKDPKEFDDEDWTFVLEVLNHKDTKALRDRLFKRPEWIEADRTRRDKYDEETRTNPTPEYMAALQAKEHEERRDYYFRRILGLLTPEELEAGRLKESPPVGLGISSATEPATPLMASTTETSVTTDHSISREGTNEPEYRGRLVNRSEHEETPSRHKCHEHGISSVARHSVEQMTDVFNTESFNPRLSILGSEELRQFIRKNPPIDPSPPTPTPDRSYFNTSFDPRQRSQPGSSPGLWLSPREAPAQRLRFGNKAASSNDLLGEYNRQKRVQPNDGGGSPGLPTLKAHPALRTPENDTAPTASLAAGSQIPRLRKAASSIAPLNSSNSSSGIRRQVIAASPPKLSTTPSLQRPPKPRKPSTEVKLPNKQSTAVELPGGNPPNKPTTSVKLPRKPALTPTIASRLSPVRELQENAIDSPPQNAPLIRRRSTEVKTPRSIPGSCSQSSSDVQLQPVTYSRPSPVAKAGSQRSAVDSYSQSTGQPVSSLLPLSYSRPSPSTTARPQRPAVDSYNRLSSDTQPVSSPLPLSFSRPSPSTATGSHDTSSPGGQLAFSPLPLSYSSPSQSAAIDSNVRSPPDDQPVSSPLPLSFSRPSLTAKSSSDRGPAPTPLLLNYSRSSTSAPDGFYVQSPPDEQPVSSPQGITYAVLPPRPVIPSSSDSALDAHPVSSPPQVVYSDPLPSTAVIPFTTFVANDGDGGREYALFAPIALPEYLPPRSLARLSRIPSFPDACDFSAALEEGQPQGPFELPATPVNSPAPVRSIAPVRPPTLVQSIAPVETTAPPRSTTPMDRLNAKRSGIPVASGSKVASNNSADVSFNQLTASFSPSPFNIGPYFSPEPTRLQPVQTTSQRKAAFPPLHTVGPNIPSEPIAFQSVSTTGQGIDASPILNVGPYFPPGPVSFGLDQNTGRKRDAPTESHHVSFFSSSGQLTLQPHQTTASERKEHVRSTQAPDITNNDLSPIDEAMSVWRNYQEKEPLIQYPGDRFEGMVDQSGTHNATTEQAQGLPQHYGSHFEIMVEPSSTMYQPSPGGTQGRSELHVNQSENMLDSSDTHEPTTEQPHPSIGGFIAQVHNPAVVGSHTQEDSPGAQLPHVGRSKWMSKQSRFGSSSPGIRQQPSPLPAPRSSKIPSFRSFSENKPPPSQRQPAAQDERSISLGRPQSGSTFTRNEQSISLGSPQSGTTFTRNERATTNAGRLAKKFENMNLNGPATAPQTQGRRYESFTPTKISRLRKKFSNVFFADPPPEHDETRQESQPISRANTQDSQPTSSISGATLDADFENVISAWESSSPVPVQSPAPQNQEIRTLRSEVGLEPLSGHVQGEQKHPNHNYSWNTKKIMCRRIHNQGCVLPSLPSPAPGQKAYMADRASEYFVGSPHTNESTGAQRCAACDACCCRFAELSAQTKAPTKNDIVAINNKRQAEEDVAGLRAKKPNGVEEWDSFLKCSQCNLSYCPKCIRLCKEVLCQQPVCMDCVESTELCPIHNLF